MHTFIEQDLAQIPFFSYALIHLAFCSGNTIPLYLDCRTFAWSLKHHFWSAPHSNTNQINWKFALMVQNKLDEDLWFKAMAYIYLCIVN